MKKKAMALTVAAMMAAAMITGCGQTAATTVETAADTTVQTEESTADTESTAADTAAADGESYTIGISQFAEHGSLDNCRTGFLEGLKEAGIEEGVNLTVLFDNAQADTATASMISDNYVSQKVDLICAIATPSAMTIPAWTAIFLLFTPLYPIRSAQDLQKKIRHQRATSPVPQIRFR